MSAPQFSLFVSSVKDKTVFRFGTKQLIGAKRTPEGTAWRPERIVAITAEEHAKYLKEYTREIRDGALRVRTREEWDAQTAADLAAEKAAADAAKKAAEAKATADKAASDAAHT